MYKKFIDLEYDPSAKAPRWEQFINEIFADNMEIASWIKKAIGYTMTGETKEQICFICLGDGANGKSLLLKILQKILGSFAYSASYFTFDGENNRDKSPDMAQMEDKRLVITSEMKENMHLDETLTKLITGGETINARSLYNNPFEFKPQCKLWFAVNHKPRIDDETNGIWRRIVIIPFSVQFDGNNEDLSLEYELTTELSGILAWAVEGAFEWYEEGKAKRYLKNHMPKEIQEMTKCFKEESDPLKDFMEQFIDVGETYEAPAGALYVAYTNWCDLTNVTGKAKLSNKSFGQRMKKRYTCSGTRVGRYYQGLRIKSDPLVN